MQFAHEDMKKDRDVVKAAVDQNGMALEYVHEDLKRDPGIVKVAVAQNGCALQFAHEDLRKDRNVVKVAVAQNLKAIYYAHEDLRKDLDIVKVVVAQNGHALQYAHEGFKKDRDVVKAAVAQNGCALQFAHEDMKKDRDVVKAAVDQNGMALEYAQEGFKKDRDVVKAAVAQNGMALRFAHEDLKKDCDVVKAAVDQNGMALRFAHEDLQKELDIASTVKEDVKIKLISHSNGRGTMDLLGNGIESIQRKNKSSSSAEITAQAIKNRSDEAFAAAKADGSASAASASETSREHINRIDNSNGTSMHNSRGDKIFQIKPSPLAKIVARNPTFRGGIADVQVAGPHGLKVRKSENSPHGSVALHVEASVAHEPDAPRAGDKIIAVNGSIFTCEGALKRAMATFPHVITIIREGMKPPLGRKESGFYIVTH